MNSSDLTGIPKLTLDSESLLRAPGFQHQFSVRETYPLHTHTFYEFFLINKGKGIHRINGSSTLLSEGSFALIRPSDVHGYGFLNQYDLELINVPFLPAHFDQICRLMDCPRSLFTRPRLCPQLELKEPLLSDIRQKMLRIGEPESSQGSSAPLSQAASQQKRRYLLSVLPWFFYQFVSSMEEGDNLPLESLPLPTWLSALLHQMEKPENFIAGLPRLISLANLSQEYVNRSFRRFLHMSPTEFINTRRMEYAASLLLEGRMEIIDICHECGFHNLSHFYRIFQRQYGCSPGKFEFISPSPPPFGQDTSAGTRP